MPQSRIPLLVLFLLLMEATITTVTGSNNIILVSEVDAEITQAVTLMIEDAIAYAQNIEARLIVFTLDTPGGEVRAVEEAMDLIEGSPIPICIFVFPLGASAWSGGTYLLMSSHIAAMASGTTIGSAQPVLSTGQPINDTKRMNALTALMVNHAKLHGRNITAAKLFVSRNLNLGPDEALRQGVIELIADDLSTLLKLLSNETLIRIISEEGTSTWMLFPREKSEKYDAIKRFSFDEIDIAKLVEYEPGFRFDLLRLLYDPLVSGLMFTFGMFLLFMGIQTPGLGAEFLGGLLLLLSLISFQVVGVEPAAIFLIVLGFVFMFAEIQSNIGFLGVAGAICLVTGSFLLIPSPNWLLAPKVIIGIRNTIIGLSLLFLAFFGFIAYKVMESKRRARRATPEIVKGSKGFAATRLDPYGEVRVEGENWRARAENPPIEGGSRVVVTGREGLLLIVSFTENSNNVDC